MPGRQRPLKLHDPIQGKEPHLKVKKLLRKSTNKTSCGCDSGCVAESTVCCKYARCIMIILEIRYEGNQIVS